MMVYITIIQIFKKIQLYAVLMVLNLYNPGICCVFEVIDYELHRGISPLSIPLKIRLLQA